MLFLVYVSCRFCINISLDQSFFNLKEWYVHEKKVDLFDFREPIHIHYTIAIYPIKPTN